MSQAVVVAMGSAAGRERTVACTRCEASTPPADQFYCDEGVICPACHLEADVVHVHRARGVTYLVVHGLFALQPLFVSALAYGALGAWLKGGVMMRSGGLTMLFMAALLGSMGLALLVGGSRTTRDAVAGRLVDIESPMERVMNGLSGAWMALNGAASLGMMGWLAWLVLVG
jgi:hypothetical protein